MMIGETWDQIIGEQQDSENSDPRLNTLNHLHWNPDEMDIWVDRAWATGLGPDDEFKRQLRDYLDNHEKQEANSARNAAWRIYLDQVFGGDVEFADALRDVYFKHAKHLPIKALTADVGVIKSIGLTGVAREVLSLHEANWSALGLTRQSWGRTLSGLDEDIVQAIHRLPTGSTTEEFDKWMERLGTSNGWSESDTARVKSIGEDEWRQNLLPIKDASWLADAIARCRRIFAHSASQVAEHGETKTADQKFSLDNLLSDLATHGSPLERKRAAKLLKMN
jgi:hypothetical protein